MNIKIQFAFLFLSILKQQLIFSKSKCTNIILIETTIYAKINCNYDNVSDGCFVKNACEMLYGECNCDYGYSFDYFSGCKCNCYTTINL